LKLRRRLRMNPVIGLDVSKGESEVQAFFLIKENLTVKVLASSMILMG
jgi:hypothetical protein